MDNVISIATVRAERWRQALSIHARNGEIVVIETRTHTITAERISCRESFAEVLDSFGDYFVINYAEICALRPAAVAQTSVVNARGEFLPVHAALSAGRPVTILPFTRRPRRK